MHRLATIPGGWNPATERVIFIEQQPAPIVFITAADTDIQTLAVAATQLPEDFPELRVVNLLQLQQQLTIDTYAEDVLTAAQVIIVRLIGGQAYWSYGLEVVEETVRQTGATLIVLPGDDRPDPTLTSHSTASLNDVDRAWQYLIEGGVENYRQLLFFIASRWLGSECEYRSPQPVPRVGIYDAQRWLPAGLPVHSGAAIIFYRAHYLSGNLAAIDALCQALEKRNLTPVPIYVSSLKDPEVQAELINYCLGGDDDGVDRSPAVEIAPSVAKSACLEKVLHLGKAQDRTFRCADAFNDLNALDRVEEGGHKATPLQAQLPSQHPKFKIQIILNTTSFSLANLDADTPQVDLWTRLNLPVFQVILSGAGKDFWESGWQGLTPRDLAMNVALPEVDGRIITRAISFKAVQTQHPQLQTDVLVYEPIPDRVEFVGELALNWVKLRQKLPRDRKVALILANYPNRDGRLANGVGLDTPQSCVAILHALQAAGYDVGDDIPANSSELIKLLTSGITNDPEGDGWREAHQSLSREDYQAYFHTLPLQVQQEIRDRWGITNVESPLAPLVLPSLEGLGVDSFPIPGIQFGNVFVGIQPARGDNRDPNVDYHAPDLVPPDRYAAFYHWVRDYFSADAIVHVGKHGNLEWLPGKSVALSENCYPEAMLGALPHLYPFIVNDPGEGSQAKRRSQAVILDHLTPPMTRAELYGGLHQLEGLIDEYYEAQTLDPQRVPLIRDRLLALIQQENLQQSLGIDLGSNHEDVLTQFLKTADGYLCELKEAQIRDGLHIFGQCPQDTQLRDLIVAIARNPNPNRLGLTRALAIDWGWDFDPLTADLSTPLSSTPLPPKTPLLGGAGGGFAPPASPPPTPPRLIGDAVEILETYAAEIVDALIDEGYPQGAPLQIDRALDINNIGTHTRTELDWIRTKLLPNLRQTDREMLNLLRGLNGEYIPSGASGAPTRGRPDVLPTGRNFYSVDIRAIPTETAWSLGSKAADVLIDRYTQEHGEYPQTLGLSIWGTSTMRTGGDDIAQAFALLGVRPVWDGVSRRVVDFEILPLSILGRPRVDVTLRISGFFRDAFPATIDLFDSAVKAVAQLAEPPEQNPLADRVRQETLNWQQQGLSFEDAQTRSQYRIFGSKPGAYGAGLQGLIDSQNWQSETDLAQAYINWSAYAYGNKAAGVPAPEAFDRRLANMQIVLQNQDNREHDLLDSDDYYQFQGGLTAAVKAISGSAPTTYFGDNSRVENPKVRQLTEEIDRVYRSRVVNPKWIAGAMRHGYKGAAEMAATLDFLFAYDATANCVQDFMYQGVADAYLFDDNVRQFIEQNNPWVQRDMAERLLEANQRGLWTEVEGATLERLRLMVNEAEGVIESQGN